MLNFKMIYVFMSYVLIILCSDLAAYANYSLIYSIMVNNNEKGVYKIDKNSSSFISSHYGVSETDKIPFYSNEKRGELIPDDLGVQKISFDKNDFELVKDKSELPERFKMSLSNAVKNKYYILNKVNGRDQIKYIIDELPVLTLESLCLDIKTNKNSILSGKDFILLEGNGLLNQRVFFKKEKDLQNGSERYLCVQKNIQNQSQEGRALFYFDIDKNGYVVKMGLLSERWYYVLKNKGHQTNIEYDIVQDYMAEAQKKLSSKIPGLSFANVSLEEFNNNVFQFSYNGCVKLNSLPGAKELASLILTGNRKNCFDDKAFKVGIGGVGLDLKDSDLVDYISERKDIKIKNDDKGFYYEDVIRRDISVKKFEADFKELLHPFKVYYYGLNEESSFEGWNKWKYRFFSIEGNKRNLKESLEFYLKKKYDASFVELSDFEYKENEEYLSAKASDLNIISFEFNLRKNLDKENLMDEFINYVLGKLINCSHFSSDLKKQIKEFIFVSDKAYRFQIPMDKIKIREKAEKMALCKKSVSNALPEVTNISEFISPDVMCKGDCFIEGTVKIERDKNIDKRIKTKINSLYPLTRIIDGYMKNTEKRIWDITVIK